MTLLNSEIQQFINNNLTTDVSKLALQKNPFEKVDYRIILNQIVCKQKAKNKLPSWFKAENIIFPERINIEQTTDERVAAFKSSLFNGQSLLDASGGFGVDSYYFSKQFKEVVHCEINNDLSAIVSHNFKQLQAENIKCFAENSENVLKERNQKFDVVYVDPSRRNETKGKVFMLKDCEPNVPNLQNFYFSFANIILVKTAPILDVSAALEELKNVKTIYAIALENEVKELLWVLDKDYSASPKILAINIDKTTTSTTSETTFETRFSEPLTYLFEPNAAIMKLNLFSALEQYKLHEHSHLFTSDELVTFPGRRFKIEKTIPFSKKEIQNELSNKKANVSTRNFPLKPEEIKKKFKIKDGGTLFAFFTTNYKNEKIVVLCTKIKNNEND